MICPRETPLKPASAITAHKNTDIPDHGGVYKPPQFGRDIQRLMEGLVQWHQQLVDAAVSPLLRAPQVHLYYELIHPFWDGNGRVGRVLEATLIRHAGYTYAPFALANFYQEQIHHYFALFSNCRKAQQRGDATPNTAFVGFHLEGQRVVLDPRYQAMYLKKTDKTRLRDIKGLQSTGLLVQDEKHRLWPLFAAPEPRMIK